VHWNGPLSMPDRVGAICTIGSSAVATGDQIGTAAIQIRAIKSDPHFNKGDYYEQEIGPVEGMGIARRIAHLTYRTEAEMDIRFGRQMQGDDTGRYAVESYLDHQANKLAQRFDANTYIVLTEAMNSHDIGRERVRELQQLLPPSRFQWWRSRLIQIDSFLCAYRPKSLN
jgi:homoserine O-acetyltransferase/O-succinyltransferase